MLAEPVGRSKGPEAVFRHLIVRRLVDQPGRTVTASHYSGIADVQQGEGSRDARAAAVLTTQVLLSPRASSTIT